MQTIRFFLLFLSCFSIVFGSAQSEQHSDIQATGKILYQQKQGDWEYTHKRYKWQIIGKYQEGKKHGVWQKHDAFGHLESEVTYQHGTKEGICIYYRRGQVIAVGQYHEGLRDGEWKFFAGPNILLQKGSYSEGQKTGYWEEYIPYQYITRRGYYVQGQKIGLWEGFHEEKRVEYGRYQKGEKTGEWVMFEAKKKTTSTGLFQNGLKEGDWTVKDQQGKIKEVCSFHKGKKHGVLATYFPNDAIRSIANYEHDQQTGLFTHHHSNGQISIIGIVQANPSIQHDTVVYGTFRVPVDLEMDMVDDPTISWNTEGWGWADLPLNCDLSTQDSILQNLRTAQFPAPDYYIRTSQEIVRVGSWKEYHPNGQLKSEGNYLPILKTTTHYSGGAQYESTEFVKEGQWREYDEQGNLIKEDSYSEGEIVYQK